MKTFSRTAAAALVAGTMGLAAFSPVAFAQDAKPDTTQAQPPTAKPAPGEQRFHQRREGRQQFNLRGQRQGMMGGGLISLVCSPRGAERLEHVFVAISHRAAITEAQKPTFEALKTAALTAQTDYADTCKAAFDAIRADGKPDPVKRMQTALAIDTARVEAMTNVLPKFEDFYKALTDDQKAQLQPRRQEGFNGNNRRHDNQGDRHHRRGMHLQSTDQIDQPAPGEDVEG